MSVRSFRPVVAVATVAAAALSCYLVSLRVAAERAGLEGVETEIVLAQRDIRSLQTEIGTRGRLEQLERWNVKVLALSAPKADQFVDGGYQLARLARPNDAVPMDAPVVLAAAPQANPTAPVAADDGNVATHAAPPAPRKNDGPASLMHVASYSLPDTRSPIAKPSVKPVAKPITKSDAAGQAGRAEPKTARPTAPKVTAATKPVKIATIIRKLLLPGGATTAKASAEPVHAKKPLLAKKPEPAKKQASATAATTPKEKATN